MKRSDVFMILAVVAILLFVIFAFANPESLRDLYCTANAAQALECSAKGWR